MFSQLRAGTPVPSFEVFVAPDATEGDARER
jgi:hypothetical protein